MITKFAILLPLIAHALPSGSCDMANVNSCIEGNQRLARQDREKAEQIAERMRAQRADIDSLTRESADLQAKQADLAAEQTLLQAELRFVPARAEAASAPPIPSFPQLEDFFALSPAARSWSARYPEERGARLAERLNKCQSESEAGLRQIEANSRKIGALSTQIPGEQNEYNALIEDARQHDLTVKSCKQEYCPGGQ